MLTPNQVYFLGKRLTYKIWQIIRESYYYKFPDVELLLKLENKLVWGLAIETCNICNANCIFCAYRYQRRKKQIMSEAIFRKAIEDYNDMGGGTLALCSLVGDPLMDPYILDRIQYARSFQTVRDISIITNCINLNKIGTEKLLTSGLSEISISTSGFDLKIHEQLYRSGKGELMKSNLISLLRTNSYLGYPCKININLRTYLPLDALNNSEFKDVIKYAESVNANYYWDDWGGRIKQDELPKGMNIRHNRLTFMKNISPCSMLYGGISILSNGTVTLCGCRDLNGDSDLVVGNIINDNLLKLYNSQLLSKIRNDWRKGMKIPDICRDCKHYAPVTNKMLKEVRINANI